MHDVMVCFKIRTMSIVKYNTEEMKYPILLPHHEHFTFLMIHQQDALFMLVYLTP